MQFSSEEYRHSTVTTCGRRCDPTMEKIFEEWDILRLLSGLSTKQPEFGASNISGTRIKTSSFRLDQAGNDDADRCRTCKCEEILQSEGDHKSEIHLAR